MARVSKAVSCQTAVIRITPPNDPPVKRRRSEAGDWGKKCLQIGRQLGNSSGDGDIAHHLFSAIPAIPRIAMNRDSLLLRVHKPVFRYAISSVDIAFGYPVIGSGRWRDDFDGEAWRVFHHVCTEESNPIVKQHDEIRL